MKHVNKLLNNEKGFTLVLALVAGLVLLTTFSLIKISTLDSFNPDLRRIGINIGPNASPNPIADNQTTDPNRADSSTGTSVTVASDALTLDADVDIDSEGDTPAYIE